MNLVRRAAQQMGGGLSISDFDRVLDSLYGGQPSYTGKLVSPQTALAVDTLWACVLNRADDIAAAPFVTYRNLGPNAGKEPAHDHYLWDLLLHEANPRLTAFRFKHLMQTWKDLWGNAYAEIEISGRGQVIALWPWRPDHVRIYRTDESTGEDAFQLIYGYRTKYGKEFFIPAHRMLHLRGISLDGILGLSPVDVHKQTIGLSMAVQEHGARYFSNGARPLGILTHPQKLDDKAYARIREDWERQHQGLDNAHRVAILEEGMKWLDVGADMVDAQYIEVAGLTAEAIARMYKMPQHRVGLLERSTNSNIYQQAQEYIMYTLHPEAENWKQEIQYSLLSMREQQSVSVAMNFRHLIKGDYDQMGKFIATLRQWEIATADEIRDEFLDWNPQPNGQGKSYLRPVNMEAEDPYKQDEPVPAKPPAITPPGDTEPAPPKKGKPKKGQESDASEPKTNGLAHYPIPHTSRLIRTGRLQ